MYCLCLFIGTTRWRTVVAVWYAITHSSNRVAAYVSLAGTNLDILGTLHVT